jgi:MFS family permease
VVGLAGAVVIPLVSDKIERRKPLLFYPIMAAVVAFAAFTFSSSYGLLIAAAAVLGFCVMGMGPVGFQYGAEIGYPLPEGTSYGLLMVMGQISGILFVTAMDALSKAGGGTMNTALYALLALMLLSVWLVSRLKESELILLDGQVRTSKVRSTPGK